MLSLAIQVVNIVEKAFLITGSFDAGYGIRVDVVSSSSKGDGVFRELEKPVGVPGFRGLPHPQEIRRNGVVFLRLASHDCGEKDNRDEDPCGCNLPLPPVVARGRLLPFPLRFAYAETSCTCLGGSPRGKAAKGVRPKAGGSNARVLGG